MKRLCFLLLLLAILVVSACSTSDPTPIPTTADCAGSEVEAADDLIYTPGGPAYRANVQLGEVINPWPGIDSATVFLGAGDDEFLIGLMYRNYIETRTGEARNLILYLSTSEEGAAIESVELSASGTPSKIKVAECMRYSGPQFRHIRVLSIEIAEDTAPGDYKFGIGFTINGTDYGTVSCTIKVID